MKLLALGPKGTNGHEAAFELLKRIQKGNLYLRRSKHLVLEFCDSHTAIFTRLLKEDCYAIVPIENSTEGLVADTVRGFWLKRQPAHREEIAVLHEVSLPIEHTLVMRPGGRLLANTPVLSHPQALGQCRGNLQRFHPNLIPTNTNSTAGAGKLVAESEEHAKSAALVSPFAARNYVLDVVQEHMEDVPGNMTRFHLLGHSAYPASLGCKTAAIFWTKNEPAALWKALAPIAKCGVNMTSVHSLPLGRHGEFAFYVEFEEHVKTRIGREIWTGLTGATSNVLWLGSFPREHLVLNGTMPRPL